MAKQDDDEAWDIAFFEDEEGNAPGEAWLDAQPKKVRAKFEAILTSVAQAPPPNHGGGLMWHAMHGVMKGIYEARVKNQSTLFRLFCLLDRNGLDAPSIVILTGITKPDRTAAKDAQYLPAREMRDAYAKANPKSDVVRS